MADNGIEAMGNFFGFPIAKADDKKIVEAVEKKKKKLEKIAEKPNKTQGEEQMIDAFERLGILPGSREDPRWKDKQKLEGEQSIMASLVKMGILPAQKQEESKSD